VSINKGLSLLNQKIVYDYTKFTTTDYIGHLSCIVWFVKCNFRCLYCYNDELVFSKSGKYSLNDVLDFLRTRVGLLDAVVLSGGEATSHDLTLFCQKVKELGFKIKLDTNATNLTLIKKLVNNRLIDYMAIDFKAPSSKYKEIVGVDMYSKFIESLEYLINIDFDFEIRTTVNGILLNESDINSMIKTLYNIGYKNSYYLQNFLQTSSNIGNITNSRVLNREKIEKNILRIQWRD